MKRIIIALLLTTTFTLAQTKDVVEIDDTTEINNKLIEIQKQYEEVNKVIENATIRKHQLEGAAWVLIDQKKTLLDTKYKKK